MRPRRLRLENFTSFRGEQPALDFSELELFVVSGPTGAGKSSLLDAMVFALYGKVPRLGEGLKELIALGRDRLSVVLDFDCRGESYRVTRVMNRGSKPSEAILERLANGEPFESIADGVTAVEANVQRVLGLSYEAFTQAVILPQNEFARFLRAKPGKRHEILRDLLRLRVYERMRERAETEQRGLALQLKAIEEVLKTFADATLEEAARQQQAFEAARETHRSLSARLDRRQQEVAELRALAAKTEELRRALRTLGELELRALEVRADEGRIAAARKAEAVVPRLEAACASRQSAERAANREREAAKAAATAAAAHEACRRGLEKAEAAAAGIVQLDARIEALVAAVALAQPLADARRSASEAKAALERVQREAQAGLSEKTVADRAAVAARKASASASLRAESARERARQAEQALDQAQAGLHDAHRHDAVATLRRGLAAGDDCPVCERVVKQVPKPPRSSLAAREAACSKARDARDLARQADERERGTAEQARSALERAESETRAAQQRAEAAATGIERALGADEAARERLQRLLADLRALTDEPDPAAAQAGLRRERERVTSERERARSAEASAAASRAGAEAAEQAAAAQALAAREQAEAEAARAEAAAREAGFASLEAARAAALPAAELRGLAEAVERHGRERHAAESRVAHLRTDLDGREVPPAALAQAEAELRSLQQQAEAAVREESRLEHQVAETNRRIHAAAAQRREAERTQARQSLMRQLALDLRIDGFQKYLLEETLRELVAGASRNLLELTGRYGLEQRDDQFFVLDHDNAGERRRAETLSGGETFLASLALALELSEQVQRAAGAVRLDSLFIDEGFGTLDAQTLEVVTQALEGLPVHGRMVGIVTHLPELTERIPSRVRVERRPEGSRFTLQPG